MIYELRRYTLRPGRRDTLIELFEREFLESQEAAGMRVPGQFREPGEPDRFTWLRSFPDMESRRAALTAFYGGPVWLTHRDAANATMIDSDDVLLLRPVPEAHGAADPFPAAPRPPEGTAEPPGSRYAATIYPVEEGFAEFFAERAAPVLAEAGVPPIACFESEHAENTYPTLPVRTEVNVFVWFARFDRTADERPFELPEVTERLTGPPTRLLLAPTARSALR